MPDKKWSPVTTGHALFAQDPMRVRFLAQDYKVTTLPHPNPRVVRIKIERVPATWITPKDLRELQQQQAAYYQNLLGGQDHIHVKAQPLRVHRTRGLAPEVW